MSSQVYDFLNDWQVEAFREPGSLGRSFLTGACAFFDNFSLRLIAKKDNRKKGGKQWET